MISHDTKSSETAKSATVAAMTLEFATTLRQRWNLGVLDVIELTNTEPTNTESANTELIGTNGTTLYHFRSFPPHKETQKPRFIRIHRAIQTP